MEVRETDEQRSYRKHPDLFRMCIKIVGPHHSRKLRPVSPEAGAELTQTLRRLAKESNIQSRSNLSQTNRHRIAGVSAVYRISDRNYYNETDRLTTSHCLTACRQYSLPHSEN